MTIPAAELDSRDPLAGFAAEFDKPPGQIYLDGNSLGVLSRSAEAALREAVESWRSRAILGWTDGPEPWFDMSRLAAGRLAPILGAEPDDVMVGQSTTVNLHQLLATYYDPLGPRPRILIDEWCFPSDRYAIESHLRLRGRDSQSDLVIVPCREEILDESELISAMADGIGLAVLPSVTYRAGQLLDMRDLTIAARELGTTILWDCSHSAGVIEHRFWKDEIDLAFGCGYKYLNGGPGAVGWLYVHPWLRERLPGLAGWFGSDPARQFEMSATFHPAADAGRFLIGTPHIFSLAPILGSLELIDRAGVPALWAKSLMQTQFLQVEIDTRLAQFGARTITPLEDGRRGGHITLAHPEAGNLSHALRARGVIPDFRPPDLLRFCPAPLYTSFAECARAINILEEILRSGAYHQLPDHDARVT